MHKRGQTPLCGPVNKGVWPLLFTEWWRGWLEDPWFCSGDAGVMTAAYLHLTAAEPSLIRPHQALFRFTADVAIAEGHYRPRRGTLPVPGGPGVNKGV
jgi:hypothetical protein